VARVRFSYTEPYLRRPGTSVVVVHNVGLILPDRYDQRKDIEFVLDIEKEGAEMVRGGSYSLPMAHFSRTRRHASRQQQQKIELFEWSEAARLGRISSAGKDYEEYQRVTKGLRRHRETNQSTVVIPARRDTNPDETRLCHCLLPIIITCHACGQSNIVWEPARGEIAERHSYSLEGMEFSITFDVGE
jgi:hypothetical protein